MTGIVKIAPGAMVYLDTPGAFMVRHFTSSDTVVLRNLATGDDLTKRIDELRERPAVQPTKRPDLASYEDSRLVAAQSKYRAIKHLADKHRCTIEEVKAVAQEANVSLATVYRWLKEFKDGMLMSRLVRKEREDKGRSRLPEQTEIIISAAITEYWLTTEKRSYVHLHREIERRCRNANVRAPSLPSVIERSNRIDPKQTALRRHGRPNADKLNLIEGSVPNADRPYSLLQIDHTLVDIELVDSENRVSIGRPWITIAIDVYTRMIAGYYISFDPPGMLGTGICIANAILPKKAQMARIGVDYEYPCVGKPTIIHLDNAREFHSKTLDFACNEYGIDIQYRKIATPRYGAHIERLMGTFGDEIKALSGATFSNYIQKGDYDSADKAIFTLKKFEEWIAHLFLGVYHNRLHTGINEPPLRRYQRAFQESGNSVAIGMIEYVPDEQRLRLDFLPMFEGTVQPYGIKIDHITYSADVLRRWVGAKDPKSPKKKRKFICRRDPRDISYIYFYDPDAKTHFKVPYRDMSHPAISLWELRAVRSFMTKQGKDSVDEAALFRAYDAMRAIEMAQQRETAHVRRSDAVKRALRRKESPQPVPLTPPRYDQQKSDDTVSTENKIVGDLAGAEGYDEIERY